MNEDTFPYPDDDRETHHPSSGPVSEEELLDTLMAMLDYIQQLLLKYKCPGCNVIYHHIRAYPVNLSGGYFENRLLCVLCRQKLDTDFAVTMRGVKT